MGSAIRLTSRNAYDMMKMTMATGSRNEAPPMIVVFKNSFKGSLNLNNVIEARMSHRGGFRNFMVGVLQGA